MTRQTTKSTTKSGSDNGASNAAAFDYRAKTAELERVLAELQDPDSAIDDAVRLHAAGRKLVDELEAYLERTGVTVRKHVAAN